MQRQLVPGLMLVALGVLFLLVQQAGWDGEAVVAVIGAAFLVGYAFTRYYGLLVPGGIMTGLGAGIIYETQVQGGGAPVLLGLGLGFLSIYAIVIAHQCLCPQGVMPWGLYTDRIVVANKTSRPAPEWRT